MTFTELIEFVANMFEGVLRERGNFGPVNRTPHPEYIRAALANPFVQAQIELGIYDRETFDMEFLGAARVVYSIKTMRMQVEYDPVLMAHHVEDLDLTEMFGYTEVVAVHEMVHLRQGMMSDSTAVEHERLCNSEVRLIVGEETYRTYERALADSRTISRVLKRIASLNKAH